MEVIFLLLILNVSKSLLFTRIIIGFLIIIVTTIIY